MNTIKEGRKERTEDGGRIERTDGRTHGRKDGTLSRKEGRNLVVSGFARALVGYKGRKERRKDGRTDGRKVGR